MPRPHPWGLGTRLTFGISKVTLLLSQSGYQEANQAVNHMISTGVHVSTHRALIGASLSEPHINGTSMRELYVYIYIYGTSVTQAIIASYGRKREIVYCAFSCLTLQAVYICHSNLANCKFTLVFLISRRSYREVLIVRLQSRRKRDKLIVSSTA